MTPEQKQDIDELMDKLIGNIRELFLQEYTLNSRYSFSTQSLEKGIESTRKGAKTRFRNVRHALVPLIENDEARAYVMNYPLRMEEWL